MSIQDNLAHAEKIASYIHSLFDNPAYKVSSYWKGHYSDGPNPYYNQTTDGLMLQESACGSPSYILTPLGKWTILGSISIDDHTDMQNIITELFKYLDVEVYCPYPTCEYPDRGRILRIKSYGGKSLTMSGLKSPENFISYADAKKTFKEYKDLHKA